VLFGVFVLADAIGRRRAAERVAHRSLDGRRAQPAPTLSPNETRTATRRARSRRRGQLPAVAHASLARRIRREWASCCSPPSPPAGRTTGGWNRVHDPLHGAVSRDTSTVSKGARPGTAHRRSHGPRGQGARGLSTGPVGPEVGADRVRRSNVVIAPPRPRRYSLAATLGFNRRRPTASGSPRRPCMLCRSCRMLCHRVRYKLLNRADPGRRDGASLWVTRARARDSAAVGSVAIVRGRRIVMASRAQIGGPILSFLLVGWQSAADTSGGDPGSAALWIVAMTWFASSASSSAPLSQRFPASAPVVTDPALFRVGRDMIKAAPPHRGLLLDSTRCNVSSPGALADGVLLAWTLHLPRAGTAFCRRGSTGSQRSRDGPGRAAVVSTILLSSSKWWCRFAAQAHGGEEFLAAHQDDVLSASRRQRNRLLRWTSCSSWRCDVRGGVRPRTPSCRTARTTFVGWHRWARSRSGVRTTFS
jgi:hypothetical protein